MRRSFESIVSEIKSYFVEGKDRIVFYNIDETLLRNELYKIQRVVEYFENNNGTFLIATSALDAQQRYDELCDKNKWKNRLRVLICNNFERTTKEQCFVNSVKYSMNDKSKIFLCFNKVERKHRVELLSKIVEAELLDSAYYSFQGESKNWYSFYSWENCDPSVKNNILSIKENLPLTLNITAGRNNPIDIQPDDIKFFNSSYFSLVTETIFYQSPVDMEFESYKFVTEKTYKPIYLKHPFIIVAWPGILKFLNEIGYRTFHPYIDESYDSITDDSLRLNAIVNEVRRLSGFTKEQWREWMISVSDIVDHNHETLKHRLDYNLTKDIDKFFV